MTEHASRPSRTELAGSGCLEQVCAESLGQLLQIQTAPAQFVRQRQKEPSQGFPAENTLKVSLLSPTLKLKTNFHYLLAETSEMACTNSGRVRGNNLSLLSVEVSSEHPALADAVQQAAAVNHASFPL